MSEQKTKFWKFGNKYFLPFEIYDYFNNGLLIIIFFLICFTTTNIEFHNYVLLFVWLLIIIILIKDRFFIEIKTSNSEADNIKLIEDLALRQENVSTSLEQKGLFVFEYLERNIFYKHNFRKRDYLETVVIFCEGNSIYVNSYNTRYFGIIRRYNLKQWIRLLHLKV
jgi:hypothetical protein